MELMAMFRFHAAFALVCLVNGCRALTSVMIGGFSRGVNANSRLPLIDMP
jgi:hypothetical protein